ncbi:hypothetical protein, partial [Georgenia thermotolerans]
MFDDEQDESRGGDGAVPDGTPGRPGVPDPDGAADRADAADCDDAGDAGERAEAADREADVAGACPPPGGLAGVLEEMAALVGLPLAVGLAAIDPDGQDPSDLVELAAQWSRVLAWAHYQRAEALAALVAGAIEHDAAPGALTAVSTEVAMRQGISRPAATRLVR